MHPYASPQAYRESSVLTASPAQLVVMLYDGAGRFLRQAEAALGEGAVAHAHERLGRADAILDELLLTLNKDAGQIAQRLEGIYVFCKRLLVEARVERSAAKVVQARTLLAELRDAWSQIAATATA
jgi:flagellar protein FliS